MAIKNPTKYVTVRRLERFRQKLLAELPSSTVASESLCEAAADEISFTPVQDASGDEETE